MWLKREDLQPIFTFKLRGAYNKLASLDDEARHRGVIAASAGNHAQGVALAARELGIPALVVMPETAPASRLRPSRAWARKSCSRATRTRAPANTPRPSPPSAA